MYMVPGCRLLPNLPWTYVEDIYGFFSPPEVESSKLLHIKKFIFFDKIE